jgi:hypothetical protein
MAAVSGCPVVSDGAASHGAASQDMPALTTTVLDLCHCGVSIHVVHVGEKATPSTSSGTHVIGRYSQVSYIRRAAAIQQTPRRL